MEDTMETPRNIPTEAPVSHSDGLAPFASVEGQNAPDAPENGSESLDEIEDSNDSPDVRKLRREAASRRAELRAAEATISVLDERLTRYQSAEAARVASEILANGADAISPALGGVDLFDILDADGGIDREAVLAAAKAVAKARPNLALSYPDNMGQGISGGGGGRSTSWSDVLRN